MSQWYRLKITVTPGFLHRGRCRRPSCRLKGVTLQGVSQLRCRLSHYSRPFRAWLCIWLLFLKFRLYLSYEYVKVDCLSFSPLSLYICYICLTLSLSLFLTLSLSLYLSLYLTLSLSLSLSLSIWLSLYISLSDSLSLGLSLSLSDSFCISLSLSHSLFLSDFFFQTGLSLSLCLFHFLKWAQNCRKDHFGGTGAKKATKLAFRWTILNTMST